MLLSKKPKIIFLDAATVDYNDIDLSPLKKLGHLIRYDHTTSKQFKSRVQNAEVVISNKVVINHSNIKHFSKLKLICVAATGYNNIDLQVAKQNNIKVTNVVGYSTTSVAEHTLMFLFALSHRLIENNDAVHSKKWSRSSLYTLTDFPYLNLSGKTLGIVGYGAIGKEVARLAKVLRMKVVIAKIPGRSYKANQMRSSLKSVLNQSDFISIHCPLSEKTRHLFNKRTISQMKKAAYLLNLARGPVVLEQDIATALKNNQIAGYATDVLDQEPPQKNHPLLQKSLAKKVLITPHVAWASRESRQAMIDDIAKTILSFKRGTPRNLVV